jgi:ribose 5-phosphate isomerase A
LVRRPRRSRRDLSYGPPEDRDELKRAAAYRALEYVKDGMVVGLGTGIDRLFCRRRARRAGRKGLKIVGIPTSERTAAQARSLNIPLTSLAEHPSIDVTIDGADEVERGTLNLIKGLGGALLREKIVAAASRQLVIVVDQEKLVERLGDHTPVPVEVVQFGWQATAAALEAPRRHPGAAPRDRGPPVHHRWRQLHARLPLSPASPTRGYSSSRSA